MTKCKKCDKPNALKGFLCTPCRSAVLRDFASLQRSWTLTENPRTLSQGFSEGGSSSERSLPGGSDWLDWRQGADVLQVLRSWVGVVRAYEGLTSPSDCSVDGLISWLVLHFDAACNHGSVASFAADLGKLAQRGRRLDGSAEPRGMSVPCQSDDCEGVVFVRASELQHATTCPGCGVQRTVAQVVALALFREVWVTPSIAALAAGVTERTLRTWAKSGRVERKGSLYWLPSIREALL